MDLKQKYRLICELEKQSIDCDFLKLFEFKLQFVSLISSVFQENPAIAIKYNLDSRIWKFGVYDIIKKYRPLFSTFSEQESRDFLDFLDKVLQQFNSTTVGKKSVDAKFKNAIGDITRYQIQLLSASNLEREISVKWTFAKKHYFDAFKLSPRNGLFLSQLGLCAGAQERYLEAAMFYLFSQSLTSPFNSKDALLAILEKDSKSFILEKVDSKVALIEGSIFKIIRMILTKIDADKANYHLEQLDRDMSAFDSTMSLADKFQWWYTIAMVCLGCWKVLPDTEKDFLSRILYSLSKLLLVSAVQFEGHVFIHLTLAGFVCLKIPVSLKMKQSLAKKYPAGELFEDVSMLPDAPLPEDELLVDFVPLAAYYQRLKFPLLIDDTAEFDSVRKKRICHLVANLTCPMLEKNEIQDFKASKDALNPESGKDNGDIWETSVQTLDFAELSIDNADNEPRIHLDTTPKVARKKPDSETRNVFKSSIIFDTNCFVQDPEFISKVLKSDRISIIIPLPVLTELNGLKNSKPKLKVILDQLVTILPSKNIKLYTSKGNLVQNYTIINEYSETKTIDDMILDCALKTGSILVTQDINMIIKARIYNISVMNGLGKLKRMLAEYLECE